MRKTGGGLYQVNGPPIALSEEGPGDPSPEEPSGLLHLAEKEGLVHIVDNHQTVDHIICNCCGDCCSIN
jgi:hypothetical protein